MTLTTEWKREEIKTLGFKQVYANLLIAGVEFITSKHSKLLSQDSIGSPDEYLIGSFNSIFWNWLPAIN